MFRFILIDTKEAFDSYIENLDPTLPLYHDLETTSLIEDKAGILCHGLYQPGKVAVAVIENNHIFDGVDPDHIREKLSPILQTFQIRGHNYKYDWLVSYFNGYPRDINFCGDSIILAHLYDPDEELNLETLVEKFLKVKKKKFKDVVGKSFATIKWEIDTRPKFNKKTKKEDAPLITSYDLGYYCAEDVYYNHLLFEYFHKLLYEDKYLVNIYENVELPIIRVLIDMKIRGVLLDVDHLNRVAKILQTELADLEQEIYEEAGYKFNINSGQQKADILYGKLGLPIYANTGKGAPSTDAGTLKILAQEGHRIAQLMLDHAFRAKILNTYALGLPKLVSEDGFLRGSYNSTGTSTLRFSSSSPNMQNLSSESEYKIRKAFTTTSDRRLIITDYSAQEYALTAHACKDENMLSVFERGEDLHQWVADMVDISRKAAKTIGFGILYGLADISLADRLGTSVDEAVEIKNKYFGAFPKLRPWIEAQKDFIYHNKFVRTPVGSVRRFPHVRLHKFQNSSYREGVNACIQGSAAIQMKMAMVKIWREIQKRNWQNDVFIIMQVHDELIVDCPIDLIEEVCDVIQYNMENAIPFRAKFKAVPNVVTNYQDGKDDTSNERDYLLAQKQVEKLIHLNII